MHKYLKLSVHDLVDFLFRTGDIDSRIYNQDTMLRGSSIHASYQKNKIGDYYSEYYLTSNFNIDEFSITLEGRADGIYLKKIPVIEEVKSTIDKLEDYYNKNKKWHLSQAICYAYMFILERKLDKADILLTYISQNDDSKLDYKFSYSLEELEKEVTSYLKEYIKFYKLIYEHKVKRNKSAENLEFPFKNYRKGQESFIKETYNIASNGGIAFIEAPTGIGKTMSSIYPFVKSFKDEDNDKIFYLTAKNTGKEAAYNALKILIDKGIDVTGIYITAKEKICAHIGSACNPDECPFAKDYYTKLKEVIIDSINSNKLFDSETIKKIADKYQICPFEFSLDLSLFMDVVIADYNYFFDPIVHLERYFDKDASKYLVLIDEAHNLLSRGQDMYSESISLEMLKKANNDYRLASKRVKNSFRRLMKTFKEESEALIEENKVVEDIPHEMMLALSNLSNNINDYLNDNPFHPSEDSIALSRALNRFNKLYENISDNDVLYYSKDSSNFSINLFCIDPSIRIRESLDLVKGAILFSATLTPFKYYKNVIGGKELDKELSLSSPFSKDNFKLLIASAALKYKDREKSLEKVVNYINEFISFKKGNYLIYAPSFEYLEKLKQYFNSDENKLVIYQNKEMDDKEKKFYISLFKSKLDKSLVGFSVVGGAFAEGIDLVADSLIGVIVIGVGLPTISFKSNLIKDYYNNKEINGFNYAYKLPGMNKVMQAVGRLIRSETDVGVAMLIDDRYFTNEYKKLFRKEWEDYEVITSPNEIKDSLKKFYK